MSAADLFRDSYDAEFRLKGTFIMVGRTPWFVHSVTGGAGPDPKETFLALSDSKEDVVHVRLGSLPLMSMIACPSGYYDGYWYARGPARHRYQGITAGSMWAVDRNGRLETGGVGSLKKLLNEIALQPKTRRPGKRPSGVITRDVKIDTGGQVFVRGRIRGSYVGENIVKALTEVSPLTRQLLDNAKLNLVDEPSSQREHIEMQMEII